MKSLTQVLNESLVKNLKFDIKNWFNKNFSRTVEGKRKLPWFSLNRFHYFNEDGPEEVIKFFNEAAVEIEREIRYNSIKTDDDYVGEIMIVESTVFEVSPSDWELEWDSAYYAFEKIAKKHKLNVVEKGEETRFAKCLSVEIVVDRVPHYVTLDAMI